MNERIEQLLEQARAEECFWVGSKPATTVGYDELEKFAELIVKECVSQIENLSPGYDDYRNQIEDAFRRDCVEQVKQHFGIKE